MLQFRPFLWRNRPRRLARVLLWLVATLTTGIAGEETQRPKRYDLPAGDAAVALRQFVRESGEQIVFAVETVRGVKVRRVEGDYTAKEALERMLEGTRLVVIEDARTRALAVGPRPKPEARRAEREPQAAREEDAVQLSPFQVKVGLDSGYGALESNALTTFGADLRSLPVTAEIFTKRFMDDLAITTVEDMIVGYAGTAGFAGSSINVAPGDRDGLGGLQLRSMTVTGLNRDGFVGLRPNVRNATGATDNFSTERVEVLEGPQSLLYGGSGGGGVINLVSKQSRFDVSRGEVRASVDHFGSKRLLFDYNVGADRAAVRIVAAGHEARNLRANLDTRFYGLYAQFAYRLSPTATVRLWGERNHTDARHAFKPNLNPFLPVGDPRRGLDARYLVLTNQVADLPVVPGGLHYQNVESLAGWWSSELIVNTFAGATFEATLTPRLAAQVVAMYGETSDGRVGPSRTLVPAGAMGNPFDVAAMQVTPADNHQAHRVKGFRATLLAEHALWGGRARSQTAFGAEVRHHTNIDSIDYAYYLADENGRAIVDPNKLSDYGRTPLGPQYFPVGYGLNRQPLFRPRTPQVVIGGRNYVRLSRIVADPRTATPENPLGLVPNNPGVGSGFLGNYSHARTRTRGVFVANLTDWFEGRVTTLVGGRFSQSHTLNAGPGSLSYRPPWDEALTGNLGFSYRFTPSLRGFASVSTSYLPLVTQTRNLIGEQLRPIDAGTPVPEIGLKYHLPDGRLAAQFSYYHLTHQQNEAALVDASFLDAVNPPGINGRLGTPDRWVNFDRRSRGAELKLTATPMRSWRLRLSLGTTHGQVASTVRFSQLYNDQFYTDGRGGVTYRDGSPVFVDPAGSNGAGTTPLTVAMLSDPTNPYYAQPDPDSGRITGANAIAALTRVDPVRGSAATGVAGLPLSAMQYAWDDPHRHGGQVTVFREGETTTGYNEYNVNLQSHYTLDRGPLKGLGILIDARTYFKNRAYYVQQMPPGGRAVQGARSLYRLPRATVFGLGVSYRRELGRGVAWTTQLNVNNALNHYRVWIVPHPVGGAYTQARLSAQPRSFLWTNTFTF